jgi:general L-amino acid transport system substrate-binding protein
MSKTILPIIVGAALGMSAAASAATLDDVKARGHLQCGVNTGTPGFGALDPATNDWAGFDVDYCRALAAAIFNDPKAVQFTPLTAAERFTALQSGEVDVLFRNTTWTMSRDTQQGLAFTGVNYYDGQGFMTRKENNVASALELDGATVCVQTGTTTELNLADYFAANDMTFTPVVFEELSEVDAAYDSGACDAYTTDASGLAAIRLTLSAPDDHILLPEIISKEPLGPVVRQGDEQWFMIVRWLHFALVTAEESGVTSANVEEMKNSDDVGIKRLLGTEGEFGQGIGLDAAWAANAIKAMGNYGEIFERNIGASTPIGLERGVNALWTEGGLQYAPPIR